MATVKKKPTAMTNNPGTLVLQWLTYAFWGWTVLALAWLTAISVGYFINSGSSAGEESTVIAYSLAAVIVLFVISLACDIFYSRLEPARKQGGAMVIMIIHAVIYALCGIAALITAVFAIVRLLIGDSSSSSYGDSGATTTLITGLIIAVVYGATLLRTLRPLKLNRSSMVYWLFMALVTVVITVLAVAGPVWNARETRDDRLIERGLPQISEAIRNHTVKNAVLPATLSTIRGQASDDGKVLIDRNLVEYKPGKKIEQSTNDLSSANDSKSIAPDANAHEYTLCVTYKAKKGQDSYYPEYPDGQNVSPDTYRHDEGRVCYELQTGWTYGKY